ncbi:DUF6966 domain-containing protein [Brucella tritici]|uniref:DUF6966 domain-containing protein n=1 Tax=Brucella tritici TaxID=94626 RepID=UPI001591B89E|nr:hypothetical protein [Brucella tritici]
MHTTHQFFPPELKRLLLRVGEKLKAGKSIRSEMKFFLPMLAELPPAFAIDGSNYIRDTASLYFSKQSITLSRILKYPISAFIPDYDWLSDADEAKYLFLFHSNGYQRAAALNRIDDAIPNSFLFAAIIWRLNDWVPAVRMAAVECAKRVFPKTSSEVIATAYLSLVSRVWSWGRWRKSDYGIFVEAISRPEVAAQVADSFARRLTGALSRELSFSLRNDSLDEFLEYLAFEAKQPAVRAYALRTLTKGYAEWHLGYDYEWIDKSMGERKRIKTFQQRPLTVQTDKNRIIRRGLSDPSPHVRKVALDAIIRNPEQIANAARLAEEHLSERSPAIRERAEFIVRKFPKHSMDAKSKPPTDDLLDPELNRLCLDIDAIVALLRSHHLRGWAEELEKAAQEVRNSDFHGIVRALNCYGGMGTLNDIILAEPDDNLFRSLRDSIFQQAYAIKQSEDQIAPNPSPDLMGM